MVTYTKNGKKMRLAGTRTERPLIGPHSNGASLIYASTEFSLAPTLSWRKRHGPVHPYEPFLCIREALAR